MAKLMICLIPMLDKPYSDSIRIGSFVTGSDGGLSALPPIALSAPLTSNPEENAATVAASINLAALSVSGEPVVAAAIGSDVTMMYVTKVADPAALAGPRIGDSYGNQGEVSGVGLSTVVESQLPMSVPPARLLQYVSAGAVAAMKIAN